MSQQPSTVEGAVDRALAKQRKDALAEVECILDATLEVAARVAPAAPRVADIVAQAHTSNQTFYRYFSGKEELIIAVFERGLSRLQTYLEHKMSKQADPEEKIAAWIHGILRQAMDTTAARQSAAIRRQIGSRHAGMFTPDALGNLLVDPLRAAGSITAPADARIVQEIVMGILNRHLAAETSPTRAEIDHIIGFCRRGITAPRTADGNEREAR